MSFFDDDAEVTQVTPPAPRSRRKRTNRSRLRIQRLVIALIALFVLVFVLALVIRSCQQNAKESSYRTYFSQVQQVQTDETNKVGKPIATLLADPTRYGKTQLETELNKLVAAQTEIATRTARISPPGKLKDLHQILVQGQQVRLAGVEQVRSGLLAALSGKNLHATARKLAALSGYFTGPDVYYATLYQTQAQNVMKSDGVSNVSVPSRRLLRQDRRVLGERPAGRAHQRLLVDQADRPARRQSRRRGHQEQRQDHDADRRSLQQLRRQRRPGRAGHGQEHGEHGGEQRAGHGHLHRPRGAPRRRPSRPPSRTSPKGATRTVQVTGLQIPTTAITKSSTLKVMAGPVPGEKTLSNNHATYTIVPVLK